MEPAPTVWPQADNFRDKIVWNDFEHRRFLTMAPKGCRAGRPESRGLTNTGVVAKIL
jgi:hypothetical protein